MYRKMISSTCVMLLTCEAERGRIARVNNRITIRVKGRRLNQVGIGIPHTACRAKSIITEVVPAVGAGLLPDDIQAEQVVGVVIFGEFT